MVIVVQQTTVVIEKFVLIDVLTGKTFDRPAGTEGQQDAPHEAGVWRLDVDMVWQETKNKMVTKVTWSGEITVGPDGKPIGSGHGTWHMDGMIWVGSRIVGTLQADGSLGVNISGQSDLTELGRVLKIKPALGQFSVDSQAWDPPTGRFTEDARAQFDKRVNGFIRSSLTQLDLKGEADGPALASVTSDGYKGSARLTPVR